MSSKVEKRKANTSIERNAKKTKFEENIKVEIEDEIIQKIPPDAFDQRMDTIIKKAIEIYHNLEDPNDKIDDWNERVAYLEILKKLCHVNYWAHRIISTKMQMKIFLNIPEMPTLKSKIAKNLQSSMSEWIKYKKLQFNQEKKFKNPSEAVSSHYCSTITSYGVQLDIIEDKIQEISLHCKNRKRSVSLSSTMSSTQQHNYDNDNENATCCLCGNQCYINFNIIKKVQENVTLKDLIQYYCRVKIDDDINNSSVICLECKLSVESFTKFCDKIDKYQEQLKQQNTIDIAPCVKEEPIERTSLVNSPVQSTTSSNPTELAEISPLQIQMVESLNAFETSTPTPEFNNNDPLLSAFGDPFHEVAMITPPPSRSTTATAVSDDYTSDDSENENNSTLQQRERIETLQKAGNNCRVLLRRLPIIFVPSDAESDEDS